VEQRREVTQVGAKGKHLLAAIIARYGFQIIIESAARA
jgi:hypothetical protein